MLTTYDGDEDIYRALEAGARAYLLKDMQREELLEVIRAVHAGQAITEGTVKTHVNSILGKMGVADRTEAATAAIRRGIVHLE